MKKILSQAETILQCREWKRNAQRVVFVSGRFALLHPGHLRLLEQARSYGDVLIVALSPDEELPHPEILQPLAPLAERAEILAALAAVDFVTSYDAPSPDALISKIAPDVVVSGAESPARLGITSASGKGTSASKSPGPQIVRLPVEPGYSTKLLLDRIAQLPA